MSRRERGFDRLAPFYDLLVRWFAGEAITASQVAWIEHLGSPRDVLVIGGGTGRFLQKLCATLPHARIVNIDLSSRMLEQARGRTGAAVEHRQGSLDKIGEDERFDLICTHCFLDLFAGCELTRVMENLDRALATGGTWLFSDFQVGPGRHAWVRRVHIRLLYLFFRITCGLQHRALPDFRSRFAGLGYRCVQSREFLEGMLVSCVYRRDL